MQGVEDDAMLVVDRRSGAQHNNRAVTTPCGGHAKQCKSRWWQENRNGTVFVVKRSFCFFCSIAVYRHNIANMLLARFNLTRFSEEAPRHKIETKSEIYLWTREKNVSRAIQRRDDAAKMSSTYKHLLQVVA
jgi:hypothetical protein